MPKFEEATSDMPTEEYKKLSQLVGDYTKNKSKMKIKSLKQITIHKMKQTVSNPMIEIKHKSTTNERTNQQHNTNEKQKNDQASKQEQQPEEQQEKS